MTAGLVYLPIFQMRPPWMLQAGTCKMPQQHGILSKDECESSKRLTRRRNRKWKRSQREFNSWWIANCPQSLDRAYFFIKISFAFCCAVLCFFTIYGIIALYYSRRYCVWSSIMTGSPRIPPISFSRASVTAKGHHQKRQAHRQAFRVARYHGWPLGLC